MGLGSAAVIAVYAAGFERTRAAAARFNDEPQGRRPAAPTRTTGEIGALTPRVTDSTHAPAPVAPPSSAPSIVGASPAAATKPHRDSEPAAKTETRVAQAVAPPVLAAAPSVTATPTPAPSPARDSVPAPAPTPAPTKPAEVPAAPRATAPVAPTAPAADTTQPEKDVVRKDGTYSGWGTSRHGDVQATVQIKNGKIVFAAISECLTRYPCSWIAALPSQVLARQSADVDFVSGATESANAFYSAVVEALNKAK